MASVFTLRFDPVLEGFDDRELRDFLKDRDAQRTRDESWKEILTPHDQPLFNALRDWRMQRSRLEGIPPYVICNNRQLAEMAHNRPQSLGALMRIGGIGKKKAEKYGEEMLAVLSRAAWDKKASMTEPGVSVQKTDKVQVADGNDDDHLSR